MKNNIAFFLFLLGAIAAPATIVLVTSFSVEKEYTIAERAHISLLGGAMFGLSSVAGGLCSSAAFGSIWDRLNKAKSEDQ